MQLRRCPFFSRPLYRNEPCTASTLLIFPEPSYFFQLFLFFIPTLKISARPLLNFCLTLKMFTRKLYVSFFNDALGSLGRYFSDPPPKMKRARWEDSLWTTPPNKKKSLKKFELKMIRKIFKEGLLKKFG